MVDRTDTVVTTLVMLFLIGGLLASLALSWLDGILPATVLALAFLAFGALGSWIGTLHSISYLRNRAVIHHSASAVTASIATLGGLGFGLILFVNVQMWNEITSDLKNWLLLLDYQILYLGVVTVIFALVTRRGLPTLQERIPRGFEVTPTYPAGRAPRTPRDVE